MNVEAVHKSANRFLRPLHLNYLLCCGRAWLSVLHDADDGLRAFWHREKSHGLVQHLHALHGVLVVVVERAIDRLLDGGWM